MSRALTEATRRLTGAADDIVERETRLLRNVSNGLEATTRNLRAADRRFPRLESIIDRQPRGPERALLPQFGRKFPVYTPSEAELELSSRRLVREDPMSEWLTRSAAGNRTANGVHIWLDDKGRKNILKPFAEENHGHYDWLPHQPGALAKREVGGYRVINMFSPGRPLVPTTAIMEDSPLGPTMIQEFASLKPSKAWNNYRMIDQQTAAAGHHIIGNYDGHEGNFRPRNTGNPRQNRNDDMVLFDHGYSFPESPDRSRGTDGFEYTDSILVRKYYRHPDFDPAVVQNVAAVRPERIGSAIQDLVSEDSVLHTLNRHRDFIEYGTIQFI